MAGVEDVAITLFTRWLWNLESFWRRVLQLRKDFLQAQFALLHSVDTISGWIRTYFQFDFVVLLRDAGKPSDIFFVNTSSNSGKILGPQWWFFCRSGTGASGGTTFPLILRKSTDPASLSVSVRSCWSTSSYGTSLNGVKACKMNGIRLPFSSLHSPSFLLCSSWGRALVVVDNPTCESCRGRPSACNENLPFEFSIANIFHWIRGPCFMKNDMPCTSGTPVGSIVNVIRSDKLPIRTVARTKLLHFLTHPSAIRISKGCRRWWSD